MALKITFMSLRGLVISPYFRPNYNLHLHFYYQLWSLFINMKGMCLPVTVERLQCSVLDWVGSGKQLGCAFVVVNFAVAVGDKAGELRAQIFHSTLIKMFMLKRNYKDAYIVFA